MSRYSRLPEFTAHTQERITHICRYHLLDSRGLVTFGIPQYDIESCAFRNIRLDDVVRLIDSLLTRPDEQIKEDLRQVAQQRSFSGDPVTSTWYRTVLSQTLKFIDSFDLAVIDWSSIDYFSQVSSTLPLSLSRYSLQGESFFAKFGLNYPTK
ncbi:hypothetical protein COV18_04895 [Candidatus Woesearchaeota archaeon CG10_big_fil_rev_8_21_14_0_10_37_12]|nr:MAG: hypothetical protein COV18_04895 [Candidatus Woesearchaeota archaeon CG10_big_fil_rev_8_21_14_0_10_37_12]